MLRTIYAFLAAFLVTIPSGTAVMVIALVRSTSPLIDVVIHFWARTLVAAAGIDLRRENLEQLDGDGRYVLVANHHSYFDIPCILAAVRQPVRFMAKASLFKIPIFGWALSQAGFIPIDRKDRRKAVKSFDLAAERIRKGNTIAVFPEEGRTATRELRPFQRGAFLLAIKSGLPVVPLAVAGTYDVFPVGAWRIRPGIVTVKGGEQIVTETMTVRDKERLAQESKSQIEGMLGSAGENRIGQ
ncbi:MAG: lysophospholipid acyltransferase family protein [Thermoanaerobaculia bacterium]